MMFTLPTPRQHPAAALREPLRQANELHPASGLERSADMSPRLPRSPDERQVRQQIDRAVGRALFDHSFAARLLPEPALAVEAERCGHAQYLAVCQIRAQELDDFSRQILCK